MGVKKCNKSWLTMLARDLCTVIGQMTDVAGAKRLTVGPASLPGAKVLVEGYIWCMRMASRVSGGLAPQFPTFLGGCGLFVPAKLSQCIQPVQMSTTEDHRARIEGDYFVKGHERPLQVPGLEQLPSFGEPTDCLLLRCLHHSILQIIIYNINPIGHHAGVCVCARLL